MFCKLVIGALGAIAVMFSSTAFAQGTAAEAKAMLEKAVAAVKADKTKALDTINKGEVGFLDRDLYVFCFNISDGKAVATGSSNPSGRKVIGQDVRTLKDATGRVWGPDLLRRRERRSNHRGQLHVSKARSRYDTGREGELCNQGRRSGLWGVGHHK